MFIGLGKSLIYTRTQSQTSPSQPTGLHSNLTHILEAEQKIKVGALYQLALSSWAPTAACNPAPPSNRFASNLLCIGWPVVKCLPATLVDEFAFCLCFRIFGFSLDFSCEVQSVFYG